MLWQCVRLFREMDVKAARRVMFTSYIYLPVVLLALLADKKPMEGPPQLGIEKVMMMDAFSFNDPRPC
jgi:hypothetical protein